MKKENFVSMILGTIGGILFAIGMCMSMIQEWDAFRQGIIIWGVVGALVLGLGMCMTMVWEGLLIKGIIVGVIGIVLLLSLIPLCKGIK